MQDIEGNSNNEDNFIKFIDNLLSRYPEPVEFVKQVNIVFYNFNIMGEERLRFLYAIGRHLYNIFKFVHAIAVFENLISSTDSESVENEKLLKLKSETLTYIGLSYYNRANYQMAIDYQNESLGIAKKIGYVNGEEICYSNIGNAFSSLGDYQKAIDYHNKALEIAKSIGNVHVESSCYVNLGQVFSSLGDYQKAIDYHNKALEIAKSIGNVHLESQCYTNLGNVFSELKDYNKTIEYYSKSLEIAKG